MQRIAYVGRKGGVGKTACAVTTADDLAHRHGLNVLLVDMDPQANATSWLGVEDPKRTMSDVLYHSTVDRALDAAVTETEWSGVWCAPAEEELASREADRAAGAELRLRRVLRTSDIESWCDVVVIDSPPSLGPLFLNVLNASTDAVVVTDSEVGGVNGLAKLMDTATVVQEETHPNLHIAGLMMNRYNAATSEHPARWEELVEKYPDYPKWRGPARVAVGTASGAARPLGSSALRPPSSGQSETSSTTSWCGPAMPETPKRRPSASPQLPQAPSDRHPVSTMRRQREQETSVPAPPAAPSKSSKSADEPVVQFSARVPRSLRHRARKFGLEYEMELQDIVVAALTEYFDRHEVDELDT